MDRGLRSTILLCTFTCALAGCETGSETAGIDGSGVRAPVAAEGPITGFGSIVVNGVHYDVGAAQIRIDGAPAAESDLEIGQLVQVTGEIDADGANGAAGSVAYDTNVRGPIAGDAVPDGALTVLGQAIESSAGTVVEIDGRRAETAALDVGDHVEVSGFVGAAGGIVATRIERVADGELRVRGIARDVDSAAFRFAINGLEVDYAGALVIDGFPGGRPSDGDEVIATGLALDADGALLAQSLHLRESAAAGTPGQMVEVEGLITRFGSPADFDVSSRRVTTSAATVYEGGGPASLAVNVKIQVEGNLDDAGTIVARKIEVKDGGRVYD